MKDGIDCLVDRLGVIEPFDYTKWQREHYAGMSVSELNKRAVEYSINNPMENYRTILKDN